MLGSTWAHSVGWLGSQSFRSIDQTCERVIPLFLIHHLQRHTQSSGRYSLWRDIFNLDTHLCSLMLHCSQLWTPNFFCLLWASIYFLSEPTASASLGQLRSRGMTSLSYPWRRLATFISLTYPPLPWSLFLPPVSHLFLLFLLFPVISSFNLLTLLPPFILISIFSFLLRFLLPPSTIFISFSFSTFLTFPSYWKLTFSHYSHFRSSLHSLSLQSHDSFPHPFHCYHRLFSKSMSKLLQHL